MISKYFLKKNVFQCIFKYIPLMLNSTTFKLPGAMGVGAAICVAGFLLTFVLPEPKQKSLETIEQEGEQMDERHEQKAGDAHTGETRPSYS